ncbi:hypothetical protein HMPREF1863_01208 [Aedoeadaptatus coxii]|uniref:Uncharacterized protein n=1 Tax=Aedoeadaptatus coxii TaxID=755172 RepID=A0A134AE40_9FIRM|nr:hypothetical protein HMPREF1863_01208 [Peptoniphilus coxii]
MKHPSGCFFNLCKCFYSLQKILKREFFYKERVKDEPSFLEIPVKLGFIRFFFSNDNSKLLLFRTKSKAIDASNFTSVRFTLFYRSYIIFR